MMQDWTLKKSIRSFLVKVTGRVKSTATMITLFFFSCVSLMRPDFFIRAIRQKSVKFLVIRTQICISVGLYYWKNNYENSNLNQTLKYLETVIIYLKITLLPLAALIFLRQKEAKINVLLWRNKTNVSKHVPALNTMYSTLFMFTVSFEQHVKTEILPI